MYEQHNKTPQQPHPQNLNTYKRKKNNNEKHTIFLNDLTNYKTPTSDNATCETYG